MPESKLHRIGLLRTLLLALLVLALLLDGLDVKLLSYAAPLILKSWSISESAFGPAMAAVLVGMAAGAWAGGWLGDRIGRRPTILISVALFGATTLGCGFATDLSHLIVLRFLGGLGFGAVTPNAFALIAEWMPVRARGLAIGFVSIASPLGGMVGATVALLLLPRFGWQGCFMIVGAATVLAALAMAVVIPESPAFLATRGRIDRLPERWRRLIGSIEPRPDPAPGPPDRRPAHRRGIFAPELARLNVGTFLCFFLCQFVNYGVAGWLPVMLTGVGLALSDAISASLTYNAMAIVAGLVIGLSTARFGSKAILLVIAATMIAALAGLAWTLKGPIGDSHLLLLTLVGTVGACSGAFMTGIYTVVSHAYPVEHRATGVGFGVMAGRVGGISTTIVSGMLLTASGGRPQILLLGLCAIAALLVAAVLVIDRHIAPGLPPCNRPV